MKGRDAKPHIGIFGRRNNGKSSLINAIAGQDISIVSEVPGTTTDPVKKSIEIASVGPVILIDTAGIDDTGELGEKRVVKALQVGNIIDMAIVVIAENQFTEIERNLLSHFTKIEIPIIVVYNKSDIIAIDSALEDQLMAMNISYVSISALKHEGIHQLIQLIQQKIPPGAYLKRTMLGGLIKQGDVVLLITPIDIEAPEGRLILPQVQAIRDILDNDAIAIVVKERETETFLKNTGVKPALVVCDTSIILKADAMIPRDIPLTGFSILLARFKGNFAAYLEGTPKIAQLKKGDKILILESCTHHVSCDDIGRVKIPRWMEQFTGQNLHFDVVAGLDRLPEDIANYSLVVQCGGCMITPTQIKNRLKLAIDAGVPVTNYGMAIAYLQGVYDRAIKPFVKDIEVDYL